MRFIIIGLFIISMLPCAGQTNFKFAQHGSGFAISENGYVITNYHVVYINNFEGKRVNRLGDKFEIVQKLNGEAIIYNAKIVSADELNDLVVLKIDDEKFKSFPQLPYKIIYKTIDKGSDVFTLGYPRYDIQGPETKVSKGNVTAQSGYRGDVGHYTISAPIDHGSSGGPLFDSEGNVIGVTDSGISIEDSKYSSSVPALSSSQFYAIKSSKILPMLDVLSDVNFPEINSIANLPFTKKVKLLEKYVFIVATFVNLSDQKTSIKPSERKNDNSSNSNIAEKMNLEIGTKVYFRSKAMKREGTIIGTTPGRMYPIYYKIRFKKSSGKETEVILGPDRISLVPL